MTAEHDAVRARLGPVGVWSFVFDALPAEEVRRTAAEIESLGSPALWVPEGGRSREIFAHLSLLLDATRRITVCSGIANVTARHPEAMAGGARTLADAFGERVVLGLGVGHQITTGRRGLDWEDPIGRMAAYLDAMDAAEMGPTPAVAPRRVIAALGPRMLQLAAERALGAHTYFVPVEHTARARGGGGGGGPPPHGGAGAPPGGAPRGGGPRAGPRGRADGGGGVGRERCAGDRPGVGAELPRAPELREQLAPARLQRG